MINTFDLSKALVEILHSASELNENCVIDYKVVPHSKEHWCELYKDVLGLLNAYQRPGEDRWLIYGMNIDRKLIAFPKDNPDLLDDANYQQLFKKIDPTPHIELVVVDAPDVLPGEDASRCFAAQYIPAENFGKVYELNSVVEDEAADKRTKKITKYYPGTSFVRIGSQTEPLREEHRNRIRKTVLPPAIPHYSPAPQVWSAIPDVLFVIGSWDESNKEDQSVISRLCNKPYNEISEVMRQSLGQPGFGFSIQGTVWKLQDRGVALEGLSDRLTGHYLNSLIEPLSEIMCSVDEKYTLDTDKRLMADLLDVNRGCSAQIREGIADFCAYLSNNKGSFPRCTSRMINHFVGSIMLKVMMSQDWMVLASSDMALPLFAEADPRLFLRLTQRALHEGSALREYLNQAHDDFLSVKLGQHLIAGVKIAARKEDALSKAIEVLVELSSVTELAKDAIVQILLPWLPQTESPAPIREGVGVFLASSDKPEAWAALLQLFPGKTTTSMSAEEPRYLQVAPISSSIDLSEYWGVSKAYCRSALEHMSLAPGRILDVMNNCMAFIRCGLLQELSDAVQSEVSGCSDAELYPLWCAASNLLASCRRHPDAEWAPNHDDYELLEQLSAALEPSDPYYSVLRLCSTEDYRLFESNDWKANAQLIRDARISEIAELYHSTGKEFIERLVEDGANMQNVGTALAHIELSPEDEAWVLSMLDGADGSPTLQLAYGYVSEKARSNGPGWSEGVDMSRWTMMRVALFYAAQASEPAIWKEAEDKLGDQDLLYWSRVNSICALDDSEDANHYVLKMVQAKRAGETFFVIANCIRKGCAPSVDNVYRALESHVDGQPDSFAYCNIDDIFIWLEENSSGERLFAAEWKYAEVLSGERRDSYLYKQLSEDPMRFMQVLSFYLKEEQVVANLDEEKSATLQSHAWRVLENWRIAPGTNNEGVFSSVCFREWLEKVHQLSDEKGERDIADHFIGKNLFYAQKADGDFFLDDAIAAFYEHSEAARSAFDTETINSRGAHFVDVTGQEEERIASDYEQKASDSEKRGYLKLGAMLRSVSQNYRRQAQEYRDRRAW